MCRLDDVGCICSFHMFFLSRCTKNAPTCTDAMCESFRGRWCFQSWGDFQLRQEEWALGSTELQAANDERLSANSLWKRNIRGELLRIWVFSVRADCFRWWRVDGWFNEQVEPLQQDFKYDHFDWVASVTPCLLRRDVLKFSHGYGSKPAPTNTAEYGTEHENCCRSQGIRSFAPKHATTTCN